LKPISLRLLLIVPFLLQISAAVGLTGYWSWRNGQEAVRDLTEQLRGEVSDRISQHLDNYLEIPIALVDSHSTALDIGLLDLDDREQLQLSFWHKVKTYQIGYLLLGFETGEFLSVGYFFGDDRITVDEVKQAAPQEGGTLTSQLIDDMGQPSQIADDLGPFIAQEEGWYKAAMREGKRTWSPVYNWLVEPYNLSIAISQPLYRDAGPAGEPVLVGAVAAEQQLANVSSFLQDLEISPNGKTFIVEPNGLLIGSSVEELPFVVAAGEPQRLRAEDSRDPLIQATAKFLQATFTSLDRIDQAQQLEFRHEGDRHYLQVTPWRDELGLDWLAVVVMPEADFMGQIQANARRTWQLCGVALLVATGLGIYTSHWITQPIKQLSDAAEKITERIAQKPQLLEPDSLTFRTTLLQQQRGIRFRELGLLSNSFRHMADQLADSFEQLTHSATHDALTGLPNRFALETALKARLAEQSTFALLFLDLDYFKLVNDSMGHSAGDRLLQGVAQRLRQSLADGDIVARFGGDEFVLLLAPRPGQLMSARGVAMAKQMIAQLQRPFSLDGLDGRDVFVGTSVGIVDSSQLSGKMRTAEDALRSADTALYQAKSEGKGQYAIFDVEMYRQMTRRLQLEMDLRHAVQSEQLLLHYQPMIDSRSGQICGFEALLRWWDARTQAMISPGEFIPIAEETGLILPLTEWVLREACQQLRTWQMTLGLSDDFVMHVNVASQQFLQPHWIASLETLLSEVNLPPHCLGLELTERTLMSHRELMQSSLEWLAKTGVRVSIDDFGTGYSSLAYLQQFAIHTLKIDRSFIQPLGEQAIESDGIVRAIIAMAHTLGLNLVAEGIETEAQRQALVRMGCQQMQGFYLARPASATDIEALLIAQQQGPAREDGSTGNALFESPVSESWMATAS